MYLVYTAQELSIFKRQDTIDEKARTKIPTSRCDASFDHSNIDILSLGKFICCSQTRRSCTDNYDITFRVLQQIISVTSRHFSRNYRFFDGSKNHIFESRVWFPSSDLSEQREHRLRHSTDSCPKNGDRFVSILQKTCQQTPCILDRNFSSSEKISQKNTKVLKFSDFRGIILSQLRALIN